ncbi:DUF2442 domain-containing protein [Salmonella enterica]|uniref:DUF2442 domain-containing protein n=3 Tax=Enterobacterales TaxID=91347 RepID=UPI0038F70320
MLKPGFRVPGAVCAVSADPAVQTTDILNGQPEVVMSVSIKSARFDPYNMWLQLSDGRTLGVPLVYFPVLANASTEQLAKFELSPYGIHWDDLDEDLGLEGFLSMQKLQSGRPRPIKKA